MGSGQPVWASVVVAARGVLPAAVLAAIVLGAAGCGSQDGKVQPWFRPVGKPAESQPVLPKLGSDENPFLVTLAPGVPTLVPGVATKALRFRVIQVQAPLGEFSRSQKVWDHLDEQAVGIETQMLLQRNGLRVGLGEPDSWPPVRAIFDAVAKRTVRELPPSMPNSLSVPLQLNNEPVDQTVFFYRSNGTMAGSFYSQATDVFRITWDFNSANIEQVVVFITPEVRQDQSGVVFKATPMGAAPVPVYEGRVFAELTCRLVVSPGGYIVLGPAADVNRTGLLGREFLVNQIDGEPYESILVIVPEVLDMTGQPAGENTKAAVPAK